MGLGDVFFHGLNIVAQKNAKVSELESSLWSLKKEKSSLTTQLSVVEKKLEGEQKARKENIEKLQSSQDKLSIEAEEATDALQGDNSRLKDKVVELKANVRKRESDAYNFGFLAYLWNFLASDLDNDLAPRFPPTTPEYMV